MATERGRVGCAAEQGWQYKNHHQQKNT